MFRSGPYKYNMNDFGHSMAAMTKARGGAKYPVYKAKAPLSRTGGSLSRMPINKEPTRGIKKRAKGKKVVVKGKEAFSQKRKGKSKRKRKRPGRPRKVGRPKGSKNKK